MDLSGTAPVEEVVGSMALFSSVLLVGSLTPVVPAVLDSAMGSAVLAAGLGLGSFLYCLLLRRIILSRNEPFFSSVALVPTGLSLVVVACVVSTGLVPVEFSLFLPKLRKEDMRRFSVGVDEDVVPVVVVPVVPDGPVIGSPSIFATISWILAGPGRTAPTAPIGEEVDVVPVVWSDVPEVVGISDDAGTLVLDGMPVVVGTSDVMGVLDGMVASREEVVSYALEVTGASLVEYASCAPEVTGVPEETGASDTAVGRAVLSPVVVAGIVEAAAMAAGAAAELSPVVVAGTERSVGARVEDSAEWGTAGVSFVEVVAGVVSLVRPGDLPRLNIPPRMDVRFDLVRPTSLLSLAAADDVVVLFSVTGSFLW